MTILVTGAAGLLGRFVVAALLAQGYRVRGLDRREGASAIPWHVGDVTDPALVAQAMRGVEGVMHIAAIPNIWSGDGQTIMRVNALGTYTVLEAAEAAGVARVVFCSSDSVAGYTVAEGRMLPPLYAPLDLEHPLRATDPYAISKVMGEDLCRAYALRGMAVVALRTVFVAYPEMAGELRARAADPAAYRGPMVGGPSERWGWAAVSSYRPSGFGAGVLAGSGVADAGRWVRAVLSVGARHVVAGADGGAIAAAARRCGGDPPAGAVCAGAVCAAL